MHWGSRSHALLATVFIDVEKDAVLRHVSVEPCTLSGHEGLAVNGEAIDRSGLSSRREG